MSSAGPDLVARLTTRLQRRGAAGPCFGILAFAVTSWWALWVIAPEQGKGPRFKTIDLYTEHLPMVAYGFDRLASWSIPLWNPHQLCGIPFLAVPHTGLFYPGNFPYLLFSAPVATEVVYVTHLLLAGWALWLLAQDFGMHPLAGLAGAATLVWSVWLQLNLNQAAIHTQACLLPATILAIERTLRGVDRAWIAAVILVACQILAGATEAMLYNVYAVLLYWLVRTFGIASEVGWPTVLRRSGQLGLCAAAGVGLAAIQLLPTLELVSEGVRSGGLSLDEMRPLGPVSLVAKWTRLLNAVGAALPFLLLVLGARERRARPLWIYGLLLVLLAGVLSSGGALYERYASLPFGNLFRYPNKFLQIYSFGLALVAAAGVNALAAIGEASPTARRSDRFAISGGIFAAVLIAASLLALNVRLEHGLVLASILVFLFLPRQNLRTLGLAVIAAVQFLTMATAIPITHERPIEDPARYDTHRPLLESLGRMGPEGRVYLSARLRLDPGITTKQAMLSGLLATGDYEALSPARHGEYFDAAAGKKWTEKLVLNAEPRVDRRRARFAGYHLLDESSNWRLMDMASTRHFVVFLNDEVDKTLSERARDPAKSGIQLVRPVHPRVFANHNALPRAYLVEGHRFVADSTAALAAITDPQFDPRTTVVIETTDPNEATERPGRRSYQRASIIESEPEHVRIDVEARAPGWLVLTDTWFAGWQATVDGEPAEILRANHLFRAVAVPSGISSVVFDYRPRSFAVGASISASTAIGLIAIAAIARRRSSR